MLFNSPTLSDITLILFDRKRKEQIHSHKVILASTSEYFMKLFTGAFQEETSKEITLEVIDVKWALLLVKWMYTRRKRYPLCTRDQARMWLIPDAIQEEDVPYPGPNGSLTRSQSDDDREICYVNTNSEGLLQKIRLLYHAEKPKVAIEFRADRSLLLTNYLQQYHINLDFLSRFSGYYLSSREETSTYLLEMALTHHRMSGIDRKHLTVALDLCYDASEN